MANSPLCKVDGCGNFGMVNRYFLCGSHYKKFNRYGDPLGGRQSVRAKDGAPCMWLLANVSYDSDDCLAWPFAHRGNGYGILTTLDGRNGYAAHRYMCELVHGLPPSDEHICAHSCGKGHEGCVNPKHLRWATHKENAADRSIHGSDSRGDKNKNAKLNDEKVLDIRASWPEMSQDQLARKYDIDQSTIWKILHRKSWAWL